MISETSTSYNKKYRKYVFWKSHLSRAESSNTGAVCRPRPPPIVLPQRQVRHRHPPRPLHPEPLQSRPHDRPQPLLPRVWISADGLLQGALARAMGCVFWRCGRTVLVVCRPHTAHVSVPILRPALNPHCHIARFCAHWRLHHWRRRVSALELLLDTCPWNDML